MEKVTFGKCKDDFNAKYNNQNIFISFVTQHLSPCGKEVEITNKNGKHNEQYYKWQFLYVLTQSGLYNKNYIGTEINLPKGNKNSATIKLDIAIFDSEDWFDYYKDLYSEGTTQDKKSECLHFLFGHLIAVIEIKNENSKNTQEVWEKQLKQYLKTSERDFCLGALYDTEHLYLFKKQNNLYLRYNEQYNIKENESDSKDLSLNIPDAYCNFPNFKELLKKEGNVEINRSKRNIGQLDTISGIQSTQINDAMSSILRTMDKVGLFNQKGFEILIKILAIKIYDEKQNEKNLDSNSKKNNHLQFYILDEEKDYTTLTNEKLQNFITRIQNLKEQATQKYNKILQGDFLDYRNGNHITMLVEVAKQFQDYSFVRSQKTDLYQLVFYKFASNFAKDRHAQFVTPLPLIDFLVKIVNPHNNESVIDPTVGIADFLSVSYVNSKGKLDDENIYGMDIDEQMIMLATLNMLLNGDGNSVIKAQTDGYGSLLSKFNTEKGIMQLETQTNANGNWDERKGDMQQLKKFDVVLTNPPFGDDRAFVPQTKKDKQVANLYELYGLYGQNKIDLGVVFLENAYRILKENGRLGIVLSNSIASIAAHNTARQWLMQKMRIVAIFDMPSNIFAETAVNTTVIVAYKPSQKKLEKLQEQNYQIFTRSINKVGYEIKTKKRIKIFETQYKINYNTFAIDIDKEGNPIIDEDFSKAIIDFKQWCNLQENKLQELFL